MSFVEGTSPISFNLPRAVLYVSSSESKLRQTLQVQLDQRETKVIRVSIAELLLEAETGETPSGIPECLDAGAVALGGLAINIPHLELLQLEVVPPEPRKAVVKWLKILLEEHVPSFPRLSVVATFWDSQKQERWKDSAMKTKIEKMFPRVVRLNEQVVEFPSNRIPREMPPHDDFWSGIVGYEQVKLALDRLVRWKWYRNDTLARMGVDSGTSGVLLYGPSGCGKTILAQRLGNEPGINFMTLKASDIYSKWYGESERAVREAFSKARAKRPCILFLDEVDALAPSRNSDEDNAVGLRVLSTFLNELDGVDTTNQGLMVVAATNRVEAVDDAALRPGRLGSRILVDLPTHDDRKLLLAQFLGNSALNGDVNFEALALRTMGSSVAAIKNMCSMARYAALRSGKLEIAQDHFNQL